MSANIRNCFKVNTIENYNNEERIVEYKKSGNTAIRDEIIEQNIPLIKSITLEFEYTTKIDRQDLVSEGSIALITAIDKFNPNKGIAFSTFATHVITNKLIRYTDKWCGKGSNYYGNLLKKCRKIAYSIFGDADIEFDEETADYVINILKERKEIRKGAVLPVRCLLLTSNIDDSNKELIENVEYDSEEEFDRTKFIKEHKEELFSKLTDKEKDIIISRYINEIKLDEIAEKNGVTYQAIQNHEKKALKKMRRVANKYL